MSHRDWAGGSAGPRDVRSVCGAAKWCVASVGMLLSLVAAPTLAAARFEAPALQQEKEGNLDQLIDKDGVLRDTLVLRDSQGGFAGTSGTIWAIEPSGVWRESLFLNERTHPPHREGHLTKDQLERLAAVLAKMELLSLPRQMGRNVEVNPRTFTVVLGGHKSILVLNPGESISSLVASEERGIPRKQWRRFAAIVQAILDATGGCAEGRKPHPEKP